LLNNQAPQSRVSGWGVESLSNNTNKTKMLKAIFTLFSFILIILIVFTWALLATLTASIVLITKIPSPVHRWQKQIKKKARQFFSKSILFSHFYLPCPFYPTLFLPIAYLADPLNADRQAQTLQTQD